MLTSLILRRILKNFQTSIHTIYAMFFADASECISNDLICAEWSLVNQIVESITVVNILHLAKDSFYRVEIRAVSNIQYWFNIQISIKRFNFSALMNRQLIHKNCQRNILIQFPKLPQILCKIIFSHCCCLDMNQFNTFFL